MKHYLRECPFERKKLEIFFCPLDNGTWVRRGLFIGFVASGMGDGTHGKSNKGI